MSYLVALVLFGTAVVPQKVAFAAPSEPVRILSVAVSSQTPQPGDTLSATVRTTSDATGVTAQVAGMRLALNKVAAGTFEESVLIPSWAPAGTYTVTFTATRADGSSAQTTLPVEIKAATPGILTTAVAPGG